MKPIRLAMIQCNPHAYWYGALLARSDAARLNQHDHVSYHFMSDLFAPSKLAARRIAGFQLATVWDPNLIAATRFSETFSPRPRACRTLEEAAQGVDAAFIPECDGDGSTHLKLATPFLRRALPMFIDKPLAFTPRDARQIVALARKHGAPLMSSSQLGFVPEARMLRASLRALDNSPTSPGAKYYCKGDRGIKFGIVRGGWGWATPTGLEGVIHGLTLAQAVFGTGVQWVQAMGNRPAEYILLHYQKGFEVIVLNALITLGYTCEVFTGRHYPYRLSAKTEIISVPSFIEGSQRILRAFRAMTQTRRPPIDYNAMVELIVIAEAARRAQRRGRAVYLGAA